MSNMSGLTFPKWLDRPHVPDETAQQRLASITLHRIALFILAANLLVAVFIPTDGSDLGVRIFGLFIPIMMLLLQRFWSTHIGFVFWYGVTFALACIEILARGGILSSGFFIIARLILGSSIAFSQSFTVITGAAWFLASLAAAIAQQLGWWTPQAAYILTPLGAWWAIAGSTLNFGMRVVVVIDEFRRGQAELRERLVKLIRARTEEENLISRRDRLFWYLSHELRSPLTRLKLQVRAAQRKSDEGWTDRIVDCGAQVEKLARLTEQSLLLAQLRGRLAFPLYEEVDLAACVSSAFARVVEKKVGTPSEGESTIRFQFDGPLRLTSSSDLIERSLAPLLSLLSRNGQVDVVGRNLAQVVELEVKGIETDSENQELPVSIARELAHRHGGDLNVRKSEDGRISFSLTFSKHSVVSEGKPFAINHSEEQESLAATIDLPFGLFRYFVFFVSAWGVVWSFFYWLFSARGSTLHVVSGVVVSACSLTALFVQRHFGIRRAFLTLYAGTALVTIPVLIYAGGVLNPVVFVSLSVLLTSVLIHSKRTVFLAVCLVLLGLGGIAVLQLRDLWPSTYEAFDPFGTWMVLILSGASFGLVLIPAILKQRAVQTHLERQGRELEEAHERNELIQERQIAVFGNIIASLSSPLRQLHDSIQAMPDSFHELRDECVLLENRLRQMRVISEAGRIAAGTPQEIELKKFLEQVCRDVNFEFAQTDREAVVRTGGNETWIEGDPELLTSAFHNVLHNALRFTPAGTSVNVSIEPATEQGVEIIVADRGQGVPEHLLESIFEPFVQADESGSGTGLGLAIAKEVVLAHGGEIKACNRAEGGLSVSMRLPMIVS